MYVKPNKGYKILEPTTRAFLPDEGCDVAGNDPFWARLAYDGDVTIVTDPKELDALKKEREAKVEKEIADAAAKKAEDAEASAEAAAKK